MTDVSLTRTRFWLEEVTVSNHVCLSWGDAPQKMYSPSFSLGWKCLRNASLDFSPHHLNILHTSMQPLQSWASLLWEVQSLRKKCYYHVMHLIMMLFAHLCFHTWLLLLLLLTRQRVMVVGCTGFSVSFRLVSFFAFYYRFLCTQGRWGVLAPVPAIKEPLNTVLALSFHNGRTCKLHTERIQAWGSNLWSCRCVAHHCTSMLPFGMENIFPPTSVMHCVGP